MSLRPLPTAPHRFPRLFEDQRGHPLWSGVAGASTFRVVSPGHAAGLDLAHGDLLLVGARPVPGDLGVLVPRGHGRPMLASDTVSGPRAEPGGGRVGEDRWLWAGRVLARHRSRRVGRSGSPWGVGEHAFELVVELGVPVTPALMEGVRRHLPGAEQVGATRVAGPAPWPLGACPLLAGGSLLEELEDAFGLRASVGIARTFEAAVGACGLAAASSVLAVEPGAEVAFLELAPVDVTTRQLDLFVGPQVA